MLMANEAFVIRAQEMTFKILHIPPLQRISPTKQTLYPTQKFRFFLAKHMAIKGPFDIISLFLFQKLTFLKHVHFLKFKQKNHWFFSSKNRFFFSKNRFFEIIWPNMLSLFFFLIFYFRSRINWGTLFHPEPWLSIRIYRILEQGLWSILVTPTPLLTRI